jgi:hypothetical protein
MTGLYWAAAICAMLAAAHAAIRLRRDRSLLVATPVVCMLALGAWLVLTAITPAVMQARPAPSAVSFIAAALGLLGTWEFLGMLAAVTGDTERPGTLVAIPVLGAVSAGLLQMALQHAMHSDAGTRAPSVLPAVTGQLVMATYYCPALGRTAALAWRCARQIPVRYIDMGMRAVATAAVAELGLIVARAAEIIAAVSGMPAPGPETAGVGMAQGIVIIAGIAGITVTAWFPAVASGMLQWRMWTAWWRLRPLWAALVTSVPDVRLPPQPGTRFSARYRLHRRVIEIRDGELALRPHLDGQVADQAADAARSAGLPPDRRDAVIEAAVLVTALAARQDGIPPRPAGTTAGPAAPAPRNDLDAEIARLLLVSREIRRSPIVRQLAARMPGAGKQTGHQPG